MSLAPITAPAQRLDKWLWYARLVKTRTGAARLVEARKVRVNRDRAVKPSQPVHAGDTITAMVHGRLKVVRVVGTGTRRGPAAEAQGLYEDLTPPDAPKSARPLRPARVAARAPGAGRPTKRDRRRIDRFLAVDNE